MAYDFRIYRVRDKNRDSFEIQKEIVEELRSYGVTWMQMTYLEEREIFILDGWIVPPKDFNQPVPKFEDVIGFGT